MRFIDEYQKFLLTGINITEAIAYTITFLLISYSIIKSAIELFLYYINPNIHDLINLKKTRLNLGESSALALSFILGVEILKLFYIKTYKQLFIISGLVIVKLLVTYFLLKEIKEENDINSMN